MNEDLKKVSMIVTIIVTLGGALGGMYNFAYNAGYKAGEADTKTASFNSFMSAASACDNRIDTMRDKLFECMMRK